MRNYKIYLLFPALALGACNQAGSNIQANVYRADQVNQRQDAKVVKILAVLPAKVEVSNAEAQRTAQVAGAVVGGVGGALIGNAASKQNGGYTALGGVAGTATGVAAGSMVPATTLVEGVSLTYEDVGGHVSNSTQVGRSCEFKAGSKAVVISTGGNETRIQPNATCLDQ